MVQDETEFTNPVQAFDILLQVLVQEKKDRFVRAKKNRIRAANFPQKKLLEELLEDADDRLEFGHALAGFCYNIFNKWGRV